MVSYKRHIAKTITWRVLGTIDTIVLAGLVSGSWEVGLTIGGVEMFTKMVLYYIHERAWYKFSKFGIDENLNHR